jgi:2-polyprenyl-3-methyl-5-hydroxy-6-metoxy-1,4-benzoquinol methylase
MNNCKICKSDNYFIFEAKILNKIPVSYYKCKNCYFIQTDNPFWLNEAYSSAITRQDVGLVNRNLTFAPLVSTLIKLFFNKNGKFLDYGGGYGMFVRIMRDKGFDFFRYDVYCENIFAQGHDHLNEEKYDLITAFEVFEHLDAPIRDIENMLIKSKNLFFSTELQPDNFTSPENWWYVMPETGQHIALYSLETLKFLAKKYNLYLYTNTKTFHLLTEKKINSFLFKLVTNWYILNIINKLIAGPKSLLPSDYKEILKFNSIK